MEIIYPIPNQISIIKPENNDSRGQRGITVPFWPLFPLVEDPAELWRGRGRVRVGVISCRISVCYFPLPLVPSRRGRGKFTSYETIKDGLQSFV